MYIDKQFNTLFTALYNAKRAGTQADIDKATSALKTHSNALKERNLQRYPKG